eukprot:scaffold287_cov337-Pavlova_lutheri.AAC.233
MNRDLSKVSRTSGWGRRPRELARVRPGRDGDPHLYGKDLFSPNHRSHFTSLSPPDLVYRRGSGESRCGPGVVSDEPERVSNEPIRWAKVASERCPVGSQAQLGRPRRRTQCAVSEDGAGRACAPRARAEGASRRPQRLRSVPQGTTRRQVARTARPRRERAEEARQTCRPRRPSCEKHVDLRNKRNVPGEWRRQRASGAKRRPRTSWKGATGTQGSHPPPSRQTKAVAR